MTAVSPADVLAALAREYPAWWVDLLGEHAHVGGAETTGWLLARSGLAPGERMLDAGAFVGAAARTAVAETGCAAVATDGVPEFLVAGRMLAHGNEVRWIAAATQKLPFQDAAFDSVWCLDAPMAPRELTRVAAGGASLCLCCESPTDVRGGIEAFLGEWAEHGWELAAHRALTLEALQVWRRVETELVQRRPHYEERYGKRGYLAQLDAMAGRVRRYERGEEGHGLFVFRRSGRDAAPE